MILEDMAAEGLLEREEKVLNSVPHGDRSGVVIEPWLMDQWYVNAAELAKPAIAAVEEGRTRFVPRTLVENLFRMDAQYPALVHLAPAVVGASHSGMVRSRRHDIRRGDRGSGVGRRTGA